MYADADSGLEIIPKPFKNVILTHFKKNQFLKNSDFRGYLRIPGGSLGIPGGFSPGDPRGPFGPIGPGPWADGPFGPIGPLDLGPRARAHGPRDPQRTGPYILYRKYRKIQEHIEKFVRNLILSYKSIKITQKFM